MRNVLNTLYLAAGLAIALAVHEYAEAFMANRYGDPSAKRMGWMRLNVRAMVDPFGTMLLPGLLLLPVLFGGATLPFAYAKPMPLNPWNFKKPDRDATLVAVSGPAANIALAFVLGVLYRIAPGTEPQYVLGNFVAATVVVGVLNIVPIPPLDGSRIIARFLGPKAREVYTNLQQYGALFMLLIFFILSTPIHAFVQAIGNGICRLVAGGDCIV